MKIFELTKPRDKILDAIYISLKANGDLDKLKWHYKNMKKTAIGINEKITMANVHEVEKLNNCGIWVYTCSEDKWSMIRRSPFNFELRVHIRVHNGCDFDNVSLIYSFTTRIQNQIRTHKTIFQALGELLNVDFRILEARYTDKYKKNDINLKSDLELKSMFSVGFSIDLIKNNKIEKLFWSTCEGLIIFILFNENATKTDMN